MKNRTSLFLLTLLFAIFCLPFASGAQKLSTNLDPVDKPRPVGAVPEPGAALLFASGLVAVSALSRRGRSHD